MNTIAITEAQAYITHDAWADHTSRENIAKATTSDLLRGALKLFTSEDEANREKGERIILIIWGADSKPVHGTIRTLLNRLGKNDFEEVTGGAGFTVSDGRVVLAEQRKRKAKSQLEQLVEQLVGSDGFASVDAKLTKALAEAVKGLQNA